MTLSEDQVKKFYEDGYLILPDFANEETVEGLKKECHRLVEEMDPKEHNTVFTTLEMKRTSDDYFMTSGDKIRYFFEDGAKDEKGELTVDKHLSINKIGHGCTQMEVTKATKLRQTVYGDDHPVVQESLNYFTALYAEAGKALYAENLKKYEEVGPPDLSRDDGEGEEDPDQPSTPTTEPSSILRKRKNTENEREKRVRFDETQIPNEEMTEREEKLARTVLLLLFITLLIIVIILAIYIYCYLRPSSTCVNFKMAIKDSIMRAKYWYYYYISGGKNKYV